MKLTCAIIDDEPLAISLLESYVNKTPFSSWRKIQQCCRQRTPDPKQGAVDLLLSTSKCLS